ncbi:MAG: hypothetical protein PHP52_14835, partial [Bacteroidales bacterium]|nr:hypothetical protein [Bacteroidales bacterium]
IAVYVLIIIAHLMLGLANNSEVNAALANVGKVIDNDLNAGNFNEELTEVEAKLIRDKALASIRNQVASCDMRVLEKGFSDIDELIENILEQKVAENKLKKIIAERGYASF